MFEFLQKSKARIAVVGGGVSGIACLWGLRDTDHEVHIYDADTQLGGHAHSHTIINNGIVVTVDTGFIAMQDDCYPGFSTFLADLDVAMIATDMSTSVTEQNGPMAWGSTSLWNFIGSWTRLFSPWFWRFMFDIMRFNFCATDIFAEKSHKSRHDKAGTNDRLESIGEYLDRKGYSEQFKKYYLIADVAAIWCMSMADVFEDYPAEALIHFMSTHGLLNTITESLKWTTVKNGSKSYVDAFLRTLPKNHHVHLETKIRRVRRETDGSVSLVFMDGSVENFDHVVLAVHANQALDLLGDDATVLEKQILGSFQTSRNDVALHLDPTVLPAKKSAQAAWNAVIPSMEDNRVRAKVDFGNDEQTERLLSKSYYSKRQICVHNDMNRLQSIPFPGRPGSPGRVIVTLNPLQKPEAIQCQRTYYLPIISSAAVQASRHLDLLNKSDNISFAGAWMGFAFHEDGFIAGLAVAKKIRTGVYENPTRFRFGEELKEAVPRLSLKIQLLRFAIATVQFGIATVEFLASRKKSD
ncbi:uncharacterized protein BHQ10_002198 [Talaromyces amestolkiae]|uniref:Amine oxidase domain-containing protein n=1 Tax=Talaromyces amestolkiae TaxID=1196081 RepID=A0A364KRL1_TALAM|nr:uncharacterized protein BHQ10_002198 [Talaromyces amestolkiae]RAO66186.1 hypothetical protein BHQ10_002198 [Talaromyces amestolkiae]